MLPVSPRAQSTQVSHTQALNLLQDSQVTEESTVRKPTPVKIVEQLMDQSDSSTAQTQRQPVTPVSFVCCNVCCGCNVSISLIIRIETY